ncbi:hypothetical protein [Thermus caliditerrae]|uniref:hypothetical protein n=1 Tax=Thermus caliditerrae TaxID=1330700 RepID=UPI00056E60C0|nr:hypothetical protein [Thermus caliditerrae]
MGLTDPAALVQEAAQAAEAGVYTFTLGFGEEYDRELLAGMALAGGGTHLYAAQGELQEALEGELAFLRGPVNLGVRLALGKQVRHLAPFAPGERQAVLLRVEGEVPLEVKGRTPHGKVSRVFPLPPRAPKGSPDWHLVELEELLAAEPHDKEETKALRQQALDLKERLEGHPWPKTPGPRAWWRPWKPSPGRWPNLPGALTSTSLTGPPARGGPTPRASSPRKEPWPSATASAHRGMPPCLGRRCSP